MIYTIRIRYRVARAGVLACPCLLCEQRHGHRSRVPNRDLSRLGALPLPMPPMFILLEYIQFRPPWLHVAEADLAGEGLDHRFQSLFQLRIAFEILLRRSGVAVDSQLANEGDGA